MSDDVQALWERIRELEAERKELRQALALMVSEGRGVSIALRELGFSCNQFTAAANEAVTLLDGAP